MKNKILTIGLVLLLSAMLIVFTGCGKSEEENTVSNEENTSSNSSNEVNEENETSSSTSEQLDETVISTFNSPIESYEGEAVTGSNVRSLIGTLLVNAASNKDDAEYIPTVEFEDSDSNITTIVGGETAVEDNDTYTEELTNLRSEIDSSHEYVVELNYAESGLVNKVIINY